MTLYYVKKFLSGEFGQLLVEIESDDPVDPAFFDQLRAFFRKSEGITSRDAFEK